MNLSQQQRCLLDLLFCQQPLSSDKVDSMDESDWDSLSTMLRQHRLAPLLHSRLSNQLQHLNAPDKVRDELNQRYRASVFRSLALQRELLQLHRLLSDAGFEYAALKGAYLAFHIYPHAALRPMRDLDILVSSEDLLPAYEMLIAAGYQRPKKYKGDLAAIKKNAQHLPPLSSPNNGIHIELHHRFMMGKEEGNNNSTANRALWSRRIQATIVGNAVSFLSEADLLLHLIDHAVYHHHFDNGALLFSDITYLLHQKNIDWILFWQLANDKDVIKGCCLVLKMAQYYDHNLEINWLKNEVNVPIETILGASLLSLEDYNQLKTAKMQGRYIKKTMKENIQSFGKLIFRPRNEIACLYSVNENTFQIYYYYYYLLNFLRLFFSRLPVLLKGVSSSSTQDIVKRFSNINSWLSK